MTTLQALKSLSSYPTPSATLQNIAEDCGLEANAELTPEIRSSANFKRAKAHAYIFLMAAPSVSQNSISFNLGTDERRRFKALAKALLKEIGDDTSILGNGQSYGYAGEDF